MLGAYALTNMEHAGKFDMFLYQEENHWCLVFRKGQLLSVCVGVCVCVGGCVRVRACVCVCLFAAPNVDDLCPQSQSLTPMTF